MLSIVGMFFYKLTSKNINRFPLDVKLNSCAFEPALQPLSGESLPASANSEDDARADIAEGSITRRK